MTSRAPLFNAWMDDFLAHYYAHRPVNATFIGKHEYDNRLPDFSEAGVGDCVNGMNEMLDRLRSLAPESLTAIEQIDRALAEGFLRIQRWEYDSQHFHRANPSLYAGEAIFGVISLFLTDYSPLSERVDAAVERMQAIPSFLHQAQSNLRQAPRAWIEKAMDECDGGLALFGQGVDLLIQGQSIRDVRLRNAADLALAAMGEFKSYLEHELLPAATHYYACGEEAFDLLMRQGHFIDDAAADIVAYAEYALAEADAYLQAHAADFGASTPDEALAKLADHHPSTSSYYASYGEVWTACRDFAIERRLVTWPDFPIEYLPRPEWTRAAAAHLYFLFYRSPAAFNRPPVHKYLVYPLDDNATPEHQQSFLRSNNDSVIKLNHVVHHGAIGHHVQNWNAFRSPSRIGQIAAVDCASRVAMFCAGTIAEGWACYATSLMDEVGFLTPLESYAEVQSRRRMAARAIVDVKLHRGDYSLEQAAAFYRQAAAMPPAAAYGEAVKNSMFPGAAMMYLSGMEYIRDLRRDLSARQGDAFSLAQFHDKFLSYGSIPVTLIGADMRREADDAD